MYAHNVFYADGVTLRIRQVFPSFLTQLCIGLTFPCESVCDCLCSCAGSGTRGCHDSASPGRTASAECLGGCPQMWIKGRGPHLRLGELYAQQRGLKSRWLCTHRRAEMNLLLFGRALVHFFVFYLLIYCLHFLFRELPFQVTGPFISFSEHCSFRSVDTLSRLYIESILLSM